MDLQTYNHVHSVLVKIGDTIAERLSTQEPKWDAYCDRFEVFGYHAYFVIAWTGPCDSSDCECPRVDLRETFNIDNWYAQYLEDNEGKHAKMIQLDMENRR